MSDVMSLLKAVGVENISSCTEEKLSEVVAWIDATLTERGKKIVKAYYFGEGEGKEKKPLARVAQEFDVTNERIRLLGDRAIRKLRKSHKQRVKLWRHKIRANN